ncbi:hypothetical protein GCM10009037_25760 [Halarchaeum grantii]|uniref:DUF8030 domain-containing protein n=1 Tax=Halarchaeum grantii TaxID=1193105 RepID=A0A830F5N1_9EURY|nr:hypothetical protein [Halarchaeum grantii]GGL40927.1 hypothetical protein GCM10009037_25760 [Halarchaeum grantii]
MAVPTDRDHASVVALVECALVELTHETVGAVFVAHQVGRSTRTQSVARDDVGEQFQKRHVDDPFKTSASPSSRGRHRHEPTGCGPNGNRPQLHRQIGDALETPRPSA